MADPADDERAALEALGYTPEWLESGLLDRALLGQQLERLQAGGTRKTERYRAQALTAWLEAEGPMADAGLDAFLSVARADPDAKMAQAAIAQLIQSPRLELPQLERIVQAHPDLLKRHEPVIRRTYLTRRLDQGVTDALIQQVMELKDASIQTRLIRDARLTRRHAELLAQQGANPTLRSNAQAWLQDKKAWK